MGSSTSTQKTDKSAEVVNSSGFHIVELHFPSTGPGILLLLIVVAGILCCACLCRRRCKFSRSPRSSHPQIPMYNLPYYPYPPPFSPLQPGPLPGPVQWPACTYDTLPRPTHAHCVAQTVNGPTITEAIEENEHSHSGNSTCSHKWNKPSKSAF